MEIFLGRQPASMLPHPPTGGFPADGGWPSVAGVVSRVAKLPPSRLQGLCVRDMSMHALPPGECLRP